MTAELRPTTSSAAALDAYREGVDRLLTAKPLPEEAFARALAADPDFALAHAALARAQFLVARIPEAKAAAAKARA
ncbi:MAG TPA: tetratricopeptide repeat protein, partial [Burkholderiales bacterium]|nr:tetratricopeptide repeat protein [Burkholderiales bacterium]